MILHLILIAQQKGRLKGFRRPFCICLIGLVAGVRHAVIGGLDHIAHQLRYRIDTGLLAHHGLRVEAVVAELARRQGLSGLAEKAARQEG